MLNESREYFTWVNICYQYQWQEDVMALHDSKIRFNYSSLCWVLWQPVAFTVNTLWPSIDDHHKWCLYYKLHKWVLMTTLGPQLTNLGVMLQIVTSLTYDSRGVICNCNIFIVLATAVSIGATTLSIMAFSIMTFSITTISITTFNITVNKMRNSA